MEHDKPSGVAAAQAAATDIGRIAELESRWRGAVEGMKFFDEPVQDMDAGRLLLVIGYLITENRRLSDEAYGRWCFTPKEK